MYKQRKMNSLAKIITKEVCLWRASPELILLYLLGGFVTAHGGPRDPDTGRENFIWSERIVHGDLQHQL